MMRTLNHLRLIRSLLKQWYYVLITIEARMPKLKERLQPSLPYGFLWELFGMGRDSYETFITTNGRSEQMYGIRAL